jgi:hypothetical protein
MQKLRIGIIDIVANSPSRSWYARLMRPNLASIMPEDTRNVALLRQREQAARSGNGRTDVIAGHRNRAASGHEHRAPGANEEQRRVGKRRL